MRPAIGVFCSSSRRLDPGFLEVAGEFGGLISRQNWSLVYGGGSVGMMGALARAVHALSGRVVGVIPDRLRNIEGVAYEVADELIVTDTMAERKRIMYSRSDAFAVLPGGFGTLEEFLEVLTLKQLGYHDKPIAVVNVDGYFDELLAFFGAFTDKNFALADRLEAFHVSPSPSAAVRHLSDHLSLSE